MDFTSFLQESETYKTIPIINRFIADTLTPIQIFQNLKEEASFILESKDASSPWSRYSFIGLQPFLYITNRKDKFVVQNDKRHTVTSQPSLQAAYTYVQEMIKLKQLDEDIPFYGGAVGFISYDAVNSLDKVPVHKVNDLGLPLYHFLFCETLIVFDHHSRELSIIHLIRLTGNEDEACKVAMYEHGIAKINMYVKQLAQHKDVTRKLLPATYNKEVDFTGVASNYTKNQFVADVEKVKEYIRAGDVFQTVLSQRFEIPLKVSGFDLYRVLRSVNPSPYLFYIRFDDVEAVGSSPERLIQIHNKHLEIHPIAGTRRRGRTSDEDDALANDLLNDEKEKAEHYMLVDLARNDIGMVAEYGTVSVPTLMELGRFSHVMHLISKVTGRLRHDVHPIDALLKAFPAGTVSGAPKVRAMQIIQELEPCARNMYAGTVAYIGFDGNIDSCITIRTIIVKDHVAYVQAGAGIVADSVPELEYKETKNKASALIRTIQIAHELFGQEEKLHV
ncbi:anthranilate synthase component I [Bacillus sp. HMF5848]|uniref:anthranilate synthase component I n=1 Tax=Bacillus sp. HMF5848 TaxID=2495421 RepID=UPI000F7A68D0|nr:anthranilate synthase component I [Bacillus sp. HMF5848]RSK27428.1 anthranilate synthase component I [Bacillus sp. HMF5848]